MNTDRHTKPGAGNDKGFTLVELLVTFVLLSIFMVAAAQVVASATNIYFRVRNENYGQQVSGILMDKMRSLIAGCEYTAEITPEIDDPTLAVGTSNSITLYDRTGTKIRIYKEVPANRIAIKYFEVTSGENTFEETDWRFDEKTYMDFEVESLSFTWANGSNKETPLKDTDPSPVYPPDVVKVELKLHSSNYGDYVTTEYMEMYNHEKTDP